MEEKIGAKRREQIEKLNAQQEGGAAALRSMAG
jgi:hypothetical protein